MEKLSFFIQCAFTSTSINEIPAPQRCLMHGNIYMTDSRSKIKDTLNYETYRQVRQLTLNNYLWLVRNMFGNFPAGENHFDITAIKFKRWLKLSNQSSLVYIFSQIYNSVWTAVYRIRGTRKSNSREIYSDWILFQMKCHFNRSYIG